MSNADPAIEGFLRATTVARDETEPATYRAEIFDGWDIFGNAHGGVMQALAARALVDATQRPDVITITGHFLAPGRVGPVTVTTEIEKAGRQFATARARLIADGKTLLAATAMLGDLSAMSGPSRVTLEPPTLPPPEECVFDPDLAPRFARRVDMRMHPDDVGYLRGEPNGVMRIRGWLRLHEEEPIDSVALVCMCDAFPPTIFNAGLPFAWTPTLEYTVHVRRRPVAGWLACSFVTRALVGGFLEEDGEVWDTEGNLVAQSRQLALVGKG